MLRSNRKKTSYGFRAQFVCPACDSACRVRASERMSDFVRRSYIGCINPLCGWTGVAQTEVTGTISMPSRFYDTGTIPPLVRGACAQEIEKDVWRLDQEINQGKLF